MSSVADCSFVFLESQIWNRFYVWILRSEKVPILVLPTNLHTARRQTCVDQREEKPKMMVIPWRCQQQAIVKFSISGAGG